MAFNLSTESLARSASRHPWRIIGIWVAVLVVALVLNRTLLPSALTTEFKFTNNPDSQHAEGLLEDRLRGPRQFNEIILVHSEELTVDDQAFQDKVIELYESVTALGSDVVASGTHYYQDEAQNRLLVSIDEHTTMLQFVMAGTFDEVTVNGETMLELATEANGKDGFKVLLIGDGSTAFESNELSVSDIEQGERFGVPVALLILLALFGALLAALIPLFLAIVAIITALGATALLGQVFDLIFFVTLMITMIGLAVGIDYSLIVVSRFREELARGLNKYDAIARTGATASRTVLFSGMTVVLALIGMLLIPATIFQSLGTGAILVVIAAVLATLTLLPAVLTLMGHRVNSLRVPFLGKPASHAPGQGGGFWTVVTRVVMKAPVVSLILTAGVLLAAAAPLLDLETGFNGVEIFPDEIQAKEAFFLLEEEFAFGVLSPTDIVIDGDVNSEAVQSGIQALRAMMAADVDFVGLTGIEVNDAGDLAVFSAYISGEPAGTQAVGTVRRLREVYVPAAFASSEADVFVTGLTAFNTDFFTMTKAFTPVVFGVVLGFSFLLLTMVFRSIVVPIKSILLNLLSVGAAYGLMVLVFQKGVGADFFGFEQTPIIDAWIPLFLFTVLFGLSMDYHVFLLSRVRERYDQTHDNSGSVAFGLRSTAGLITGAALIMVAVFSGFASGQTVANQQVGFGLAVAVLLDATLVRSILVPAAMQLLGHRNWYFPKVLSWLPDVRAEAPETPEDAEPTS
jgi:RND superfamily putative drug exporter